jgi:hypothetical protein
MRAASEAVRSRPIHDCPRPRTCATQVFKSEHQARGPRRDDRLGFNRAKTIWRSERGWRVERGTQEVGLARLTSKALAARERTVNWSAHHDDATFKHAENRPLRKGHGKG